MKEGIPAGELSLSLLLHVKDEPILPHVLKALVQLNTICELSKKSLLNPEFCFLQ